MKNNTMGLTTLLKFIYAALLFVVCQSTLVHADSIVKVFKSLDSQFRADHMSEYYSVWVKKIHRNDSFIPIGVNETFNPAAKGYAYSFSYKSINDIVTNRTDSTSKCYKYFYKDSFDSNKIKYNLESSLQDITQAPYNSYSHEGFCNDASRDNTMYADAYDIMTHTNNWTSFDIGHDGGTTMGAARIYIQLNHANQGNNSTLNNIDYNIWPSHVKGSSLNPDNGKYIQVRHFGNVKVPGSNNSLYTKRVLIIDVLEPQGTDWSGQFSVTFDNAPISKGDPDFRQESLDKHPLMIFANPLPKWYGDLIDKSNYDGCPRNEELVSTSSQPINFFIGNAWTPGKVVKMAYPSPTQRILGTNPPEYPQIPDLVLGYSGIKKVCIPGGVYLKGRFVHSQEFHTGTGDPNNNNNLKGVKIVGRGILSGIHVKHRWDGKTETDPLSPNISYEAGGGYNGSLIHLKSAGQPFGTDVVTQDCYARPLEMNVNCVQGITMVDSPKAGIESGGARIDIENVKVLGWHINSDGISPGTGSKVKNVFTKVNDDSIHMGKSDMLIENATVWRQRFGSVVRLSWNLKDISENSVLDGLNVIRFDPEPTTNMNANAAIIASRNMMGGTLKKFTFKNIVVDEAPYQIINLQLDDTRSYKESNRTCEQNNIDGTGFIREITIDGLFTPTPYMLKLSGNDRQKSVLNAFDEVYFGDPNNNNLPDDDCEPPTTRQTNIKNNKGKITHIDFRNVCIGDTNASKQAMVNYGNVANTNYWNNNMLNYYKLDGVSYEIQARVCLPLRQAAYNAQQPWNCNYDTYRSAKNAGTCY